MFSTGPALVQVEVVVQEREMEIEPNRFFLMSPSFNSLDGNRQDLACWNSLCMHVYGCTAQLISLEIAFLLYESSNKSKSSDSNPGYNGLINCPVTADME